MDKFIKYSLISTEIALIIGVIMLVWSMAIPTYDYFKAFLVSLFLGGILLLQDINSRKDW